MVIVFFLAASIGYVEEADGGAAADCPHPDAAPRNQKVSSGVSPALLFEV